MKKHPGSAGVQERGSKLHLLLQQAGFDIAPAGDVKFAVEELRMGAAGDAAKGIEAQVGLHPNVLGLKIRRGLESVEEEFYTHGSAEDHANFDYVVHGTARTDKVPDHVMADAAKGRYHGGAFSFDKYDRDHDGKRLDDFVKSPEAVAAGLSPVEVACLRLYTTSSFPQYNRPLRARTKPHPFAMTVFHAANGIKKLRAVAAGQSGFNAAATLFRGIRNKTLDFGRFKEDGGTELAFMSTTADLGVAKEYAGSGVALIFRFKARGMAKGSSIRFLSVYPDEQEVLYPPLTFLLPEADQSKEGNITFVDVSPQIV
mmetsp:Transcript_30323/g.61046  ORF Transcript_30323/g.61046 Transcript_30323/m.61046 type:complete len:314 (-) Transcript_30323:160-1101(-)